MIHLYPKFQTKAALLTFLLGLAGGTGLMAQTSPCGPIVENFNNTGGTTAGFTSSTVNSPAPGFTYGSTTQGGNTNGFLQRCAIPSGGSVYELTTPTFLSQTGQTSLGYGFELSGPVVVSQVTVLLQYFDNTGQINTVQVATFNPNYTGTGNNALSTQCRTVDLTSITGFTPGERYRFIFQFTIASSSNSNQCVIFDNFRTTGTIAQAALPVSFTNFTARKSGAGIQAVWNVAGERDVLRYEVERSTNGRDWSLVGTVAATGAAAYAFTDNQPVNGVSFYRVRNIDADGKFKYTSVARVNTSAVIGIKAFPQPMGSQVTIEHPAVNGKGRITLSSATGQVVRNIDLKGDETQTVINVSSLQPGLYVVRFDNGSGSIEQVKLVKQ